MLLTGSLWPSNRKSQAPVLTSHTWTGPRAVPAASDLPSGEMASSRECFERALNFDPNHVEANLNLATLLEEEERNHAALRHYKVALNADPMGQFGRSTSRTSRNVLWGQFMGGPTHIAPRSGFFSLRYRHGRLKLL